MIWCEVEDSVAVQWELGSWQPEVQRPSPTNKLDIIISNVFIYGLIFQKFLFLIPIIILHRVKHVNFVFQMNDKGVIRKLNVIRLTWPWLQGRLRMAKILWHTTHQAFTSRLISILIQIMAFKLKINKNF